LPVSTSVTVPVSVPVGALLAGGRLKSSIGVVSSPSAAAAKKPMPRWAKTAQILSRALPLLLTVSACRIELRMSRKDGLAGDSSIALVTSDSESRCPSAPRRSQRVSPQISPSACTSGTPRILPKSP
jgi:hypothetical protein